MSLYEKSEKNLDELSEIINDIKGSKDTLSGSVDKIDTTLRLFTSCIKEVQVSTEMINKQQAKEAHAHKEFVNKFDATMLKVQQENVIIRRENEEIHARFFDLNKAYQNKVREEVNEKLLLLENNLSNSVMKVEKATRVGFIILVVLAAVGIGLEMFPNIVAR